MEKLWIVRAHGGDLIPLFIDNSIVALGWDKTPSFKGKDKEFIKKSLHENYPESKKSIFVWASFFEKFVNSMQKGDYVLTYDTSLRIYHLGKIDSDYLYEPSLGKNWPHIRKVKWFDETIPRDLISSSTKNSLGSSLTLFTLTQEQKDEIFDIFSKKKPQGNIEEVIEEENKEFSQTLLENSRESLKDKLQSLTFDEMEELVKEILNAMGYIANRTKKGGDRGVDVFASKDGLGLEEPRIFVEVKHRKGQIGSQDIRSFLGGRQTTDKCIYVSTGGFSKDANYEAERSTIPISLVDIDKMAEIISLHYDKFSAEGKTLLPLKKVYIPL